jgi:hypothetical protein
MLKFQSYKSFFVIFLLLPGQIFAQIKTLDPIINPGQFKIHHIGPEDEKSSPYIMSAFQDQFGYVCRQQNPDFFG